MKLSAKLIKQIKKEYPRRSPEELAERYGLRKAEVYGALGLKGEQWCERSAEVAGWLICFVLASAPFVFLRGLSNFADLPQRAYIQLLAAAIGVVWIFQVSISRQVRVVSVWIYGVVGGFVAWSAFSLLWAVYGYEGFYVVVHWAACAGVGVALMAATGGMLKWGVRVLWAVSVGLTGVIILGLEQQFFGAAWVPVVRAPAAVFANPNVAADYVVMALPGMVGVLVYAGRRWSIGGAALAVVMAAVFIRYTGARAGWVGMGCGILWSGGVVIWERYGRQLSRRAAAAVVALAVCGAVLFWYSGWDGLYGSLDGSAQYRLVVWRNSLEMVRDKPLAGFGAGGFKLFYPAYRQRAVYDPAFDKATQIRRVHNDYMQAGVELGVPGAVLLVGVAACGLMLAWRYWMQGGRKKKEGMLVLGASAGLAAFMGTALFSFPLQRSVPPLMLFGYVGVIGLMSRSGQVKGIVREVKVPRALGLMVLAAVFAGGCLLARFNWRDIKCDSYMYTALRMEKTRRNDKALEAGLKALTYNPYRTDVMSAVGHAYESMQNHKKAIEVLEALVQKNPFNLNALFILAVAYANDENNEKALKTLLTVLRIKPDFQEARSIVLMIKTYGKARINLS